MTKAEILKELEMELAEMKRREARIDFLKLLLKHSSDDEGATRPSKLQKFIADHPDLEPHDIEFLRKGEVTTLEVSKFLTDNSYCEISPRTVARRIGSWYRPGKSDDHGHGKKRMVETLSVIERHLTYQGVGR
jgi:hypothetical protein